MCYMFLYLFFFFKQKTAYDMRISDWSSDVCSSDLPEPIDDDEIAGPQQAERMVQERRVRAGDGDGHRDADDPLAPEEGPDAPIHETEMARMPDRGGLGDRKSTRLNSSH